MTTGTRPKNWLVESILVTLFCCLPFGIVGIINAASVNSKFDAGDIAGAETASKPLASGPRSASSPASSESSSM
ncbi:MAG: CD225/dispanin family protein [Flavobacteriales bacterium]|nr:CD225/dispanin family protein [Flavobacteriales bacterium]